MKATLIFISGLAIGAGILLLWAFFQIKQDGVNLPQDFSDANLDRLPIDGEWLVFWGGENSGQNAHHGVPAQHLALDLVIAHPDEQKTHQNKGKENEDYLCWAQPVFAAHNGKIIISVDGIPDNLSGEMNPQMVYGNTVMIQHESGYVSVYAHLKLGSVAVKTGDLVKAGDKIGVCGNSGNSSEPHLHFHVQDKAGFEQGVASRPVFKQIYVNGIMMTNHSPVKSERIRN